MTIGEQLAYGVRYFDIRINKKDKYIHHGICTYKIPYMDVLVYLDKYAANSKELLYISLNYENTYFEKNYEQWFKDKFEELEDRFHNLVFIGGYCKHPYRKIINTTELLPIYEKYWEFFNYKYTSNTLFTNILHFNPKYWAKKDNNRYKEECKDGVLVLDYVEL